MTFTFLLLAARGALFRWLLPLCFDSPTGKVTAVSTTLSNPADEVTWGRGERKVDPPPKSVEAEVDFLNLENKCMDTKGEAGER